MGVWAALVCGVLVAGCGRVWSGQILRYTQSQHSRAEEGLPGVNVTGNWSWVDKEGERRQIWYVADTGGFRAFGDVVPSRSQPPTDPIPIGVPVVVGVQLFTERETLAKGVRAFPSEQRTLGGGVPALGAGQTVPVKGTGSNPEPGTATLAAPGQPGGPPSQSLSQEFKSNVDGGRDYDVHLSGDVISQPRTLGGSSTAASATTSDAAAPPSLALPVFATQDEVVEAVAAQSASYVPQRLASIDKEDDADLVQQPEHPAAPQSAEPAAATPPGHKFVDEVFQKLSTVFTDTAASQRRPQTPQRSQDIKNFLVEIMNSRSAESVTGTDFVLVSRLQIPNAPKPRVGSRQLVPQPVSVKSHQTPPVIMGLHTSGRPARRRLHQGARSLAPLGIHLLNLVPVPHSRKNVHSNGPVPRPVRVVGEPSLDNFYRPAQLARTTPAPFRLPSPMRDYDYLDYDYYDYADHESSSKGGPGSPFHKSKSKSVSGMSDENSKEGDTTDSEEKEN
ncbi:uncharacterized protein [Procambarus clarkii]|uniref:uncharacterized protein n=1 Tax=Procambarus clarkii TaxID=6728 RepID=UPI0037422661